MTNTNLLNQIYFGGGCFWCTEAVFKMLKGVRKVVPGYMGGTVPNPTYDQVCGGMTGHAEVVLVEYDPAIIKIEDLLTVFFGSHDPTTKNRQGNDVGTQYRSVIFYQNQKQEIEKFIKDLDIPAVTEIKPASIFYEAENYHQDYFANNPGNPYCQVIINPKLEKVQEKYAHLLKTI